MLINKILVSALISTTLLLCFKKWGWIDWYAIHRKQWMPESDCYLCLGFWFSLPYGIYYLNPLIPFCAAAIVNYIVNNSIINDHSKGRR